MNKKANSKSYILSFTVLFLIIVLNGIAYHLINNLAIARVLVDDVSTAYVIKDRMRYIIINLSCIEIFISIIILICIVRNSKSRVDNKLAGIVAQIVQDYATVFIVDFYRDTYREIKAVESLVRRYGNDGSSYTAAIDSYVENAVYRADRKKLKDATLPNNIRKMCAGNKTYTVKYRQIVKGYTSWSEMTVYMLNNDEFIIAFADRDDITVAEMAQDAISSDFYGMYLIELESDTIKAVKNAENLQRNDSPRAGSYTEVITSYIKSLPEKKRAPWKSLNTIEGVRNLLRDCDKREFIFESKSNSMLTRASWYVVERINKNASIICLAFTSLDTEQAERERLNETIKHQKNLLSYFVESYSSAYSVDLARNQFEILHMTSEFSKYFKHDGGRNEMIKFIRDHIDVEDRSMMLQIISSDYVPERLRQENSFSFTVREKFGKETRTMRCVIVRGIDEYHVAIGFLDISDELKKEQDRQLQLEDALSMAESANRAKTTFLSSMSHDIRTPMNAIIGYTELARNNIENHEKVLDYLSKINRSSDHLLSLINDVLDMSHIESGKIRLAEGYEDLDEIISILSSLVQTEIAAKNIDFTVDTTEIINYKIICDKLHLNQILLNILSNAIKYTDAGGSITFTAKELKSDYAGYSTYEFRIVDNGMGMSDEFLKTVFEPFTRAQSTTMSGIQGTGLGMAITKNLVDMMGGTIDIKSKCGLGTTVILQFGFKLYTPLASDEAAVTGISSSENTADPYHPDFTGRRILLVEDNELNRELATELLSECGFVVDTAEDGLEAVNRIRSASEGDYDLILMDVQMPNLDGYEATRQIRALGTPLSRLPIIAMTANAFEEDRKLALEAGMDDHVAKPINFNELQLIIAQMIN